MMKFGIIKKGKSIMSEYMTSLLSLEHTMAAELFSNKVYPHEALSELKEYIYEAGKRLRQDLFYNPEPGIWIAKSASVADSACVSGPCIIDEEAELRHCAFIRGSVIIGRGAVVGNSTELKNSILFDGVQVPHYNYIGDSVLGYKAHMGAGAITSNVKSDKSLVSISYGGEKFCSGLKKLGAILGDQAEIGCGSVLNPGAVIGRFSNVYPLSSVRGYVPGNSIYKRAGEITNKY